MIVEHACGLVSEREPEIRMDVRGERENGRKISFSGGRSRIHTSTSTRTSTYIYTYFSVYVCMYTRGEKHVGRELSVSVSLVRARDGHKRGESPFVSVSRSRWNIKRRSSSIRERREQPPLYVIRTSGRETELRISGDAAAARGAITPPKRTYTHTYSHLRMFVRKSRVYVYIRAYIHMRCDTV